MTKVVLTLSHKEGHQDKSHPDGQLSHAFQAGETCPACQKGRLDYDGCLNLVCPQCGYFAGGGSYT